MNVGWTTAGIGSLPGTDMSSSLALSLQETPEVVAVPELPTRGVGADMIGRALAISSGAADLQPAGWRLTAHSGADQRRARALLRRDLDDLEEGLQGFDGIIKLAIAGPWTLAATVERPRGDKVLADHGARRELALALAHGVSELLEEMGRRLAGATWWLQVDEPLLAPVLDGQVSTASGFSRHRRVDFPEATAALDLFAGIATRAAVHFCGAPPVEMLPRLGVDAVSIAVGSLRQVHLEPLARWWEMGRHVWWGAVPTHSVDEPVQAEDSARQLLQVIDALGLARNDVLERGLVTPACGLASLSPERARHVLRATRRVADQVEEQLRG